MHQSTIPCSRVDVESLIKNYEEKKESLKEQLLKNNKKLGQLKLILSKSKNFSLSEKYDIPIRLITDAQSKTDRLKWKKEVIALLKQFDVPFNCNIAYKKLLLSNKCSNSREKFILANLCSALSSLANSGKIFKCKNLYGRGYVYGLSHFFDKNLRLLPKYDNKLRKELGLNVLEIII